MADATGDDAQKSAAQEQKDAPKTSGLAAKDYVTFFLSSSAFILSMTTFYYTNYRVDDNLQARIIDVGQDRNERGEFAIINVTFSNAGNRQAAILCPQYILADTINMYNGGWGSQFDNKQEFPILLQSKEIKIANLRIPIAALNLNRGKFAHVANGDSVFVYYCGIHFFALNSKASLVENTTDPQVKIYYNKHEVRSILSASGKDFNTYPSTVIFNE